jgi:hypothetical protein
MMYLAAITVLGRMSFWQKSTLDSAQPKKNSNITKKNGLSERKSDFVVGWRRRKYKIDLSVKKEKNEKKLEVC